MICKYFLPFHIAISFFWLFMMQKSIKIDVSHLIFAFVVYAFGVIAKKSLSRPMPKSFPPVFLSRSFRAYI